jgi:hypothetical protein
MVVENLQTTPLMEWLFGPGWTKAALLHPVGLIGLLLLLALATAWLLHTARRDLTPESGKLLGVLAAAVAFLIAALAILVWAVGPAMAAICSVVVGPMLRGLEWLLGPEWYLGRLYQWLLVLACAAEAVFAVGWLVAALRGGPAAATARCGRLLREATSDLVRTSPRRVAALSWLAVRESIRRRVVVVFAVFVVLMLFAGWYLSPTSDNPGRLYLQFVLNATQYLVLLLALVLSALSLPSDIKDRTLHTVVTKPVRQIEIVLGRILGFAVICTALLAAMVVISYVFTVRGLDHTHTLTAADLQDQPLPGNRAPLRKGHTSRVQGHEHEVTIDPAGGAQVDFRHGHTHELTIEGSGAAAVYKLGPPQGMLVARVPLYGTLHFKDRAGKEVEHGVNVGDEWTYRSFIEGQTQATAIWEFQGITPQLFPAETFPGGLPLEMTIEVFRTHKGDMSKGILGSLRVRNPKTGRKVEVHNFLAKKFATDVQIIPRTLVDHREGREEKLDLFRDLVSDDGRLDVEVQCLQGGQYFGMAQPDVYFRTRDASFPVNFIKGYLGIWLQMMVVLAAGVMFSTFLSGPVAIVATLGLVVAGLFSPYLGQLAEAKVTGGGPFEAFVRIVTQENITSPLEPALSTNVAKMSDRVVEAVLWLVAGALPALGNFNFADYVAYGFNVSGVTLAENFLRAAAFLLPVALAGYLFLKLREVAK